VYRKGALIAEHPRDEVPTLAGALRDGIAAVPEREHRQQLIEDLDITYAYIADEGFIVGCAATKDVPTRVLWDCLSKTEQQTQSQPDAKVVRRLLEARMKYANTEGDKIGEVNKAMEKAKDAAVNAVELAVKRGETVDILNRKSTTLAERAKDFDEAATAVKRHFCMQHMKFIGIVVGSVLLFILIVVMIVCKPNFSDC
jgi:vesicle-associated membrane protein 7